MAAPADDIPVLLDTDIGTNIDDALCLAYLLRQPRCRFLGITTVTGRAGLRASLCDAILLAAGRADVPIFAGAETPTVGSQRQVDVPLAPVLDHRPHRKGFASEAGEFLRDAILTRPHQITLLTVGPMTNIARMFQSDPNTARFLKAVVSMCGYVFGRVPDRGSCESNAANDPHALAAVLRAPVRRHVFVTLDVTVRCRLSADEFRRRLPTGANPVIKDMADLWFKSADSITLHDSLAAAVLFEPDLCSLQPGCMFVKTDPPDPGLTTFDTAGLHQRHHLTTDVAEDRFLDHLLAHL